jgi:hypothetical protein
MSIRPLTEKQMHKYEWKKGVLLNVGRKYVYYRVPLKSTHKFQNVKLVYDRQYDWEFER